MDDFIAWVVLPAVVFFGIVFGAVSLGNYDNTETLRINNERCGTVAALAGANEWETNYDGECFFTVDGKLEKVEVE